MFARKQTSDNQDQAAASSLPSGDPSAVRTLVVDDDEAVKEVFATILAKEGYEVTSVASGEAALAMLREQEFDIMLADIFMPGMDGFALLQQVRTVAPDLPVILLTGYANVQMARKALHSGASDFVTKPCSISEIPIIVERNLTRQSMARRRTLKHRVELESSYESVLDALLTALDTRDTETEGHSERVTAYTMLLADALSVTTEAMYDIERGALLHDIGKIGVPDRILLKPGPLTPEEWVEMRKHPAIGYRMCARIDFLRGSANIVLHHHERWDGSGYPDGLTGEAIPLGARIFAVVDAFDAMTTDRPYRAAQPFTAACAEIRRFSGTQFDPGVVDAFLNVPEARWQKVRHASGR